MKTIREVVLVEQVDIKCSYFTDYSGREATLVHELAHSMDGYYVLQSGGYMYKNFTTLYNKYNISSSPFSSYSKTSDLEFFAEIYPGCKSHTSVSGLNPNNFFIRCFSFL